MLPSVGNEWIRRVQCRAPKAPDPIRSAPPRQEPPYSSRRRIAATNGFAPVPDHGSLRPTRIPPTATSHTKSGNSNHQPLFTPHQQPHERNPPFPRSLLRCATFSSPSSSSRYETALRCRRLRFPRHLGRRFRLLLCGRRNGPGPRRIVANQVGSKVLDGIRGTFLDQFRHAVEEDGNDRLVEVGPDRHRLELGDGRSRWNGDRRRRLGRGNHRGGGPHRSRDGRRNHRGGHDLCHG
mmetsp:Transcript_21529/g.51381  ORF Transcript_21529/g.51381 Transcript_21529/m.51381 type:complete len:237 (-) Transcript_21529:83-793(-)